MSRAGARRPGLWLALALVVTGVWQAGGGLYIHAKAALAQALLDSAWRRSRAGEAVRPWPWADTWPVARLRVPRLQIDQVVLAGASGRTLAFGPGHMDGTALPGAAGNSVLGGHRDTHFRFLARLKPGDEIEVEPARGAARRFRVTGARVADQAQAGIELAPDRPRLTLVTCYPFDAVRPGGPLRYIVTAEASPAAE